MIAKPDHAAIVAIIAMLRLWTIALIASLGRLGQHGDVRGALHTLRRHANWRCGGRASLRARPASCLRAPRRRLRRRLARCGLYRRRPYWWLGPIRRTPGGRLPRPRGGPARGRSAAAPT